MNFSLGCAFSFEHIIMNLKFKELKFTCKECYDIVGDNHRDILVKRIFMFHLKLVLMDIIDNNATFHLPLTGSKKSCIHMQGVRGEAFKRLRRAGKWRDVDIVNSMFTGYILTFYMLGNRTPRTKSIYLHKELRDRITLNTNNGMAYGDGKLDTTVKDYLLDVYKQFPTISKRDIDKILKFCWRSIYLHNSYGGDTLLRDCELWCYIGNLKKDSLEHFSYYIRKLTIKIRVLYKRKNIPWDGYYYFSLTDSLYKDYIAQSKKTGRPRKRFKFGAVRLYLILDECRINESGHLHIFRVPFVSKLKLRYYIQDFKSDKAELIIDREPLKFKDILTYNNKYETL